MNLIFSIVENVGSRSSAVCFTSALDCNIVQLSYRIGIKYVLMFSNATKRIRKAGCIVIILLLMCIVAVTSRRYADDSGFYIVEFQIYLLCLQEQRTQCDNIIKSKNLLSSNFYAYNIPIYLPTTRRRVRYRRVWRLARQCRHNHTIYLYIIIPHIDQSTDIVL